MSARQPAGGDFTPPSPRTSKAISMSMPPPGSTAADSNDAVPARPHESSLGNLPTMESAPSSANFALSQLQAQPLAPAHPLSSLPPPAPPPKARIKGIASPPRSGNTGSNLYMSMSQSSSLGAPPPLPPPPTVAAGAGTHTPPTSAAAPVGIAPSLPKPPTVSPTPPGNLPVPPMAPALVPSQQDVVAMEEPDSFLVPPPKLPLTTFAGIHSESDSVQSLLARRHTHLPILVIATESANRMAWKNGLQLVDLFQGIVQNDMTFNHANLPPFRSISKSVFPSQLLVNFMDPTQTQPHAYEEAHQLLQEHAQLQDSDGNVPHELILLEDRVEELLQPMTKADKEQALSEVTKDAFQLTSPLDIPWLVRYKHALDATTNGLAHELIQTPAMVLLVCSTQEVEPPIQVLHELSTNPNIFWPAPYQNGQWDPKEVRQEMLVLHDGIEGPAGMDEAGLRAALQRQFGPQSQVLSINTVPVATAKALEAQENTDIWGGGGKLGNRLSVNDRVLLRRYFQALLTSSLLPAVERRVATLNAVVSERKKGVRNLVKNFWRKPKEEAAASPAPNKSTSTESTTSSSSTGLVKYRYDSIESQTRLLGDTLFLMKDYEAALSIYRLIRDDYKSDKAYVQYANTQELMALCMYDMDPFLRAREIFASLETALLHYTRAAEEERQRISAELSTASRPPYAPHATRLATRLCLLLSTASDKLTKGRELEVADLLASASSHESSLGAAVLLEQASAFYYEARLFRKYGFHMLMSGHMFRTAKQDNHAFRCFASALYVYRHGLWKELHNHLQSALAAQLYGMGRMSVALLLYAKLAADPGKVSTKSQQKFLAHMLEICRDHPKKALAGADRMVPTRITSRKDRELAKNQRVESLVEVIRFTPKAARVLELPYMGFPHIDDLTVECWTHAESHFLNASQSSETTKPIHPFETALPGSESTWNDLEIQATAELKVAEHTSVSTSGGNSGLDETVTAALSKIADKSHRKVIGQIDRETQSQALVERSRKKGNIKPKPKVRAKDEPITCSLQISNPLSVNLQLTQIQLVVKLSGENGTLCTNEHAIRIGTGKAKGEEPSWKFPSSGNEEFWIADFCRIVDANQKASKSAYESEPYFVVTKQDLSLEAGASATLSASVSPLVEGDLEIIGLRCKLQDEVWVCHYFDIPGPLLNNSRSNRANKVRGESLVLKSKIERQMPCLEAELIPRDRRNPEETMAPLLEGQIGSWTLRLRNVGSAPASNVSLKTNYPWVNLQASKNDQGESKASLEGRATSNCLGPTGTLMRLPLQETDRLLPGETVDLPLQIRTFGSGKQDFYMLYRYDWEDPDGNEKARTRWLRKMFRIPVFPSLIVSAHCTTSSWKDDEQILSVEIMNNRTDQPTNLMVTLDKLSLASRRYRLEVLPGQYDIKAEMGNVLQLGWNERVLFHYRVIPLEQESPTCLLTENPFKEGAQVSKKECTASDSTDFLCLERAYESFQLAWRTHQQELARAEHDPDGGGNHPRSIASIRRANTVESGTSDMEEDAIAHPTSISKLCPSETVSSRVHLICNWRAVNGDEVVRGEHHLRGVPVRPVSFFDGCPITATAKHPSKVSHDFSKGPVSIPVELTLRNQMMETPVNFVVSMEEPLALDWIGPTRLPLCLQANEHITIPFDALVCRGGIHDLQAFQVTIQEEGKEEYSHSFRQQWLLHATTTSPQT